jgi:hypothetical protein
MPRRKWPDSTFPHPEQRDRAYRGLHQQLAVTCAAAYFEMEALVTLRAKIDRIRKRRDATVERMKLLHREELVLKARLADLEQVLDELCRRRLSVRDQGAEAVDYMPWRPVSQRIVEVPVEGDRD